MSASDSPAVAALDRALDPKNFPHWAQACPKATREMQGAVLRATIKFNALNPPKNAKDAMSVIFGELVAVAFAAGMKAVEEARGHGLDVRELK